MERMCRGLMGSAKPSLFPLCIMHLILIIIFIIGFAIVLCPGPADGLVVGWVHSTCSLTRAASPNQLPLSSQRKLPDLTWYLQGIALTEFRHRHLDPTGVRGQGIGGLRRGRRCRPCACRFSVGRR